MLQFDPRKRIDVQTALKHPWLAQLHDEAAEPAAPGGQLVLMQHASGNSVQVNSIPAEALLGSSLEACLLSDARKCSCPPE